MGTRTGTGMGVVDRAYVGLEDRRVSGLGLGPDAGGDSDAVERK